MQGQQSKQGAILNSLHGPQAKQGVRALRARKQGTKVPDAVNLATTAREGEDYSNTPRGGRRRWEQPPYEPLKCLDH